MKKYLSLLLAVLLLFALVVPAYADGTVTYDGSSRKFIFSPGSLLSPTNLFPGFENVMPGDTLTERIVIRNGTFYGVKLNVYMRSLGAQQGTNDFLSQLELSVQQVDDSYMFKAPADQTAQLTNWTYIGTVYSGGNVTLDVTLKVPFDLNDDYQNSVGYIDWQFMVEELPVSPTDPTLIKTGDTANVLIYAALAGVFTAAFVFLFILVKRKKTSEE